MEQVSYINDGKAWTCMMITLGKTVILEAAVQILSQEENTDKEILFFMALGETKS